MGYVYNMDVYIARQPVFDIHLKVYGYELLYRKTQENRFLSTDADEATSNVIINSFNVLGIENLTAGKRAFINFTGNLLEQNVATLFPKDVLVVEILETVEPESKTVEACKQLKHDGYLLALDDFVCDEKYLPFVELADIIKVDFRLTEKAELRSIIRRLSNGRIRFLAEKVETQEEFEMAKKYGYTLFQGYFFSKPVIQPVGEIPPNKLNNLRLLELLNKPDVEFAQLSSIVSNDISLSYKLLRLINSSAFGLRTKIESVKHALVMLGIKELKKWLSLITMRGLSENKPDELVRLSLIRAKMLEELAIILDWKKEEDELFLLGLFSCLDVLLNRPLAELLEGLLVSDEIKDALLRQEGLYGFLFSLVVEHEKGHWEEVNHLVALLNLDTKYITPSYLDAVTWCSGILDV